MQDRHTLFRAEQGKLRHFAFCFEDVLKAEYYIEIYDRRI